MDHMEPKTRTEKKGRDKKGGSGPYSSKHVRLQEARPSVTHALRVTEPSVTRVTDSKKGVKGK
jgi:hypothetical protein